MSGDCTRGFATLYFYGDREPESLLPASECSHEGFEDTRCKLCDERPWICDTCGHRLIDHSYRKEPNSGKMYHAGCGVPGCWCRVGENRLSPQGAIG